MFQCLLNGLGFQLVHAVAQKAEKAAWAETYCPAL